MDLKCKMKSKVCIDIHIKCQYWYTFVSIEILPHIHMMKIHGSLRNTIFTFFMIRKMILNLLNIISNYIGNTWWTMDMHHNGTRCGMMHVHISLKVANHGILCRSIQTWPWATRCARFFWEWSWERSQWQGWGCHQEVPLKITIQA